MSRIYLHH